MWTPGKERRNERKVERVVRDFAGSAIQHIRLAPDERVIAGWSAQMHVPRAENAGLTDQELRSGKLGVFEPKWSTTGQFIVTTHRVAYYAAYTPGQLKSALGLEPESEIPTVKVGPGTPYWKKIKGLWSNTPRLELEVVLERIGRFGWKGFPAKGPDGEEGWTRVYLVIGRFAFQILASEPAQAIEGLISNAIANRKHQLSA
jgi:hypothetical protein